MQDSAKKLPTFDPAFYDAMPDALKAIYPAMVEAGMKDIVEQSAILNSKESKAQDDALIRAMHSIKSCSAQLGGAELSHFAAEKEHAYLQGHTSSLTEDTERLMQLVTELDQALEAFLQR